MTAIPPFPLVADPSMNRSTRGRTLVNGLVAACLSIGVSTSFGQVSVRTQLLAKSSNSIAVNAWIKNSGTDTLRNLEYVWYMDWTDHGSIVVAELDWASISGVTMSATQRPDYIAEARYNLGSLALAPGVEVQLNTRLHLKDWSSFQSSNDWSFAGLKTLGVLGENPNVSVFANDQRVWGYPEQRLSGIGSGPKIQVRTVKTQQSSNTLGMDIRFVNTGSVPVTGVVGRWMTSTSGRTSSIVAASDWSDADSVYLRTAPGAPGTMEVSVDLGPSIIGVGREKLVKLRLYSSDWSAVDWSQDWSYPGISPTGWNDRVEVEVRGYPSTGSVPDDVDSDGDGWSNAQETLLGTDPSSSASRPEGIPMKDGLIQDMHVPHVVTYDASPLPGYSTRKNLTLTIPAGAVEGVAPRITAASAGAYPPPVFDGALQVGSTLEIQGTIEPGQSLEMPIPLVDGLIASLSEHIQVVHFVNGRWQHERVTKIENGAAYVQLSSFSPIAVGLVQQRNWLAAGDGFGLSIDKQGFPWAAGRSDFGQLGDDRPAGGAPEMSLVPVHWPHSTTLVAVAAGNRHALALDAEGSVWAWGDNSAGQCGRASAFPLRTPVKVVDGALNADQRVVQIAAGGTSSYAVTVTGQVLCWGDNSQSQLGRGVDGAALSFDSVPRPVIGLDSVRQVAAGNTHAIALRANGTLRGWGSNRDAAIYRANSDAGPALVPTPIEIPLDLVKYGADTVTASGCSGPNGTGCWSHTLLNPWYQGPSSIAAGGTTSLARAYNRKSSGWTALNLAWGGNRRRQISATLADSILIPVVVSSHGRSEISVGASHLLETWYDGYRYDEAAGAVGMLYPVQGRGYSYAANPTGDGSAVTSAWNEVFRSVVPRKRLQSNAVAAGNGVSFSWDSGADTVYAWGEPWGSVVTGLPRRPRSFLTFVNPVQGDILPSGLQSINVQYQLWTDGVATARSQNVTTAGCAATGPCQLLVQDQGVSGILEVVFKTGLKGSATPISGTIDVGKGEHGRFRIELPYAAQVGIDLWLLSMPNIVAHRIDWGVLARGSHELEGTWIDEPPAPGSYGMTLYYRYAGGAVKADTLRLTTIDSALRLFPRKLYSGLSLGGPDSFLVTLEGKGVLRGRLKRNFTDQKGEWMDGGWDLRDSGQQRIGTWNVSHETKQPILDSTSSFLIDWEFRKVVNGLRVTNNSCLDWVGLNSFHIDPFLSELPAVRINGNGQCVLGWEFNRKSSSGSLTHFYGNINAVQGEADHPIPFDWRGPNQGQRSDKWSLGVGVLNAWPLNVVGLRAIEIVR